MNEKYKVRPTTDFIDVTMKFLTCKSHNGGNECIIFHTFHWKHHLPSDQPDKTFQGVTQIRTVIKGKATLYSTKW